MALKQRDSYDIMIKYTFRLPHFVIVLLLLSALSVLGAPNTAFAQYRGAYPGQQQETEEKEAMKPQYPQVFSSHVSSVQQTQRLDEVYDGLYASLWNYAISDFNYQKQLYDLIQNDRFQTTRYAGEFSGLLEQSMENLNENHKKLEKALEDAEKEFKYVRGRVREIDKKKLDELWSAKIAEYKEAADAYFKMQHSFLKTYNHLVSFILAQGGGYYYKSDDRTLRFFKNGIYEYYGKNVDKLHRITYEQTKLLKRRIPASMDPDLLK